MIKHCLTCKRRYYQVFLTCKCSGCGGLDNIDFFNWKIADNVSEKDIDIAEEDYYKGLCYEYKR